MKKLAIAIMAAAALACGAAESQTVTLAAHQGEMRLEPPNTPASLKRAFELGSKVVEFDVFDTDENQMVCFHWYTELKAHWGLEKKSSREITKQEIAAARLQNPKFRKRYPDMSLPTLEQMLAVVPKDGVVILDARPQDKKRFAKLFDAALLKAGLKRSQIIPTAAIINELVEISPEYGNAIFFACYAKPAPQNPTAEQLIARVKKQKNAAKFKYIGVGQAEWGKRFIDALNDKDFFRKIKAAGFVPCAWTTDDPKFAKMLIEEYGVEFILTNTASAMRQALGIPKDR